MIAISLRFITGRYHATPWGRHPNEGIPEWPPAPWRLLRAIVAGAHRATPGISDADIRPLLTSLASSPEFFLPPATVGHTRHYMPRGTRLASRLVPKEEQKPDLVFDTFVVVDRDQPVFVVWTDAGLSDDLRAHLRTALAHLTYIGRAESWCTAELVYAHPPANCFPLKELADVPRDYEPVRVLVPAEPLDIVALAAKTADLREKGQPPYLPQGARWALYARQRDALAIPPPKKTRDSEKGPISVVRYAVAGDVPPTILDSVKVGDLARRGVMARYGRLFGGSASPVLSGKDSLGRPLAGHRHALYLPTDEDGDGWIDHLTVVAAEGLGEREQEALASLSVLRPWQEGGSLRLVLVGLGDPEDLPSSLFGPSRVWRSATPFVPVRHPKWRGQGRKRLVEGPESQIHLELQRRGFPVPESVEPLAQAQVGGRTMPWLAFYLWRGKGRRATGCYGFRLRFAQPVSGPIALGYGAHFGLGLFASESEE